MKAAEQWPKAFDGPRFASDHQLYDDVVSRLSKGDLEGDDYEKSFTEAKALLEVLRNKLAAQPIEDEDDREAAVRFIGASTALVGLLNKPEVRQAVVELRKVKDKSLGNLLGFMRAFNLRFGAATTLKEKQAHQQLFGIIDQTRDRILSEAKLDSSTRAQADEDHLHDTVSNSNGP